MKRDINRALRHNVVITDPRLIGEALDILGRGTHTRVAKGLQHRSLTYDISDRQVALRASKRLTERKIPHTADTAFSHSPKWFKITLWIPLSNEQWRK